MKRTPQLLVALFLGVCFASHCEATVWYSDGTTANIQAMNDNCHFSSLYQGYYVWALGWIYGVADHNVFDCLAAALSFLVWHDAWGNDNYDTGNGSWAEFPYYGTEKFWFIEDNTIRGSGTVQT